VRKLRNTEILWIYEIILYVFCVYSFAIYSLHNRAFTSYCILRLLVSNKIWSKTNLNSFLLNYEIIILFHLYHSLGTFLLKNMTEVNRLHNYIHAYYVNLSAALQSMPIDWLVLSGDDKEWDSDRNIIF
jgi:hypothetical protein